MTQTMNNQNNSSQKRNRPGQRQQERLMRIERRKRRQRIVISTITALVLIGVGVFGFLQFQNYSAQQAAAAKLSADKAKSAADKNASATASVYAAQTAAVSTPTPSAGAATPPPLSGTPTAVALTGGLQYIDIKVGTGPAAQTGSTVSVQYTGWLASNGQKFDSSYDHGGQPFSVTLGQGQVIPGWDQGLVGMKAGGTRRLLIPPALAYGANGQPPTIPANATLLFDVTVISIK